MTERTRSETTARDLARRPSLPYGRHWIGEEEIRAVTDVLRSDRLTQGPAVERFEHALAACCGVRHAVAVVNGTAGLHLACLAAGVGPGRRVLTVSNTFLATANAVIHAGGEPCFVDIDPRTWNMDPALLARRLDEVDGVSAVMPVHFAGYPADMDAIAAAARRRGVAVIEDAAHALGSRRRDRAGRWQAIGACDLSDLAVFSFHPVKQITTAEGGAVLTNDDSLARTLRELRNHGGVREPERLGGNDGPWYYEMQTLGYNYRLSDVHAALGSVQLGRLESWNERRRALVARYHEALRRLPDVGFVEECGDVTVAWHLMVVQVPRRAEVYRALHERGILAQVHYLPVHMHPYYRRRFGTGEGDLPHTEAYYRSALSLPLYPALGDEDVDRVVEALSEALERVTT